MAVKQIRLAAVQMDCQPCQVQANLEHATTLVEEAARRGAELVLLPELMPSGYLLTEEIWDFADTEAGLRAAPCGLVRRIGY